MSRLPQFTILLVAIRAALYGEADPWVQMALARRAAEA